jgi:hypothetical protein
MAKLLLLFMFSAALIALGAYVSRNPQALERFRHNGSASIALMPRGTFTNTNLIEYADPNQTFTLMHPANWQLDNQVPGCGPVWFANPDRTVWLTVCGPYLGQSTASVASQAASGEKLIEADSFTLNTYSAIKQVIALETGTNTQVYIDHPAGTYAVYFTNLPGDAAYQTAFDSLLPTITFNP